MKNKTKKRPMSRRQTVEQPDPFTPGITKSMVRQHAYELFRDKLHNEPLTLENWILAEQDLVQNLEAEELEKR